MFSSRHEVVGEVVEVGSDVTKSPWAKSSASVVLSDVAGIAGHATRTVNNTVPRRSGHTTMCTPTGIRLKVALPVPWLIKSISNSDLDVTFVVKIPDGMSPEQAAPLLCAGSRTRRSRPHGGEDSKSNGTHVTVISSSDKKKLEALEHLGADEYLVSSDAEIPHPPAHAREEGDHRSFIGSMKETEEMLGFCKERDLTSMIEVVKMDYINTAIERLENNDVRYRFVVDVAGSKIDQ
ncbi:Detected protein of unknown function [Hibiscus syriacus]|uniref:cinnamyl-alcohol dehydrogenase n=1 Tax=Hibiscus syriacus TaxID=106335 RepID=A0A6A2XC61_HIBSY|nr:Detected protein of unknown function [Hibiscus syriacus]